LKQHFAVSGVPFFDIGSVSDEMEGVLEKSNYRHSSGLGLRIAWNVNTILRFDCAMSKEDKQFFFNLGHAF
jgi:outer membrane protein assembly factor BamA